jgi:hypothetical protein
MAGIVGKMPADHRRFLVSFKGGQPDWALLNVPGAELLPAVRWRVESLASQDPQTMVKGGAGSMTELICALSDRMV